MAADPRAHRRAARRGGGVPLAAARQRRSTRRTTRAATWPGSTSGSRRIVDGLRVAGEAGCEIALAQLPRTRRRASCSPPACWRWRAASPSASIPWSTCRGGAGSPRGLAGAIAWARRSACGRRAPLARQRPPARALAWPCRLLGASRRPGLAARRSWPTRRRCAPGPPAGRRVRPRRPRPGAAHGTRPRGRPRLPLLGRLVGGARRRARPARRRC